MSRDLGGKTAGGFRLGDILARGGASTVYAAEQTGSDKQAAVKVFNAELPRDKNAAAKLLAELQRVTAIKHHNLVAVLEVGTIENKGKRLLYIAMERLHGESLKARMSGQRQAMPLHVALQIAGEVGGALQAITRAGATHRQISPSSVFLVPPSDEERRDNKEAEDHIYLLDLGASLVPVEVSKDSGKTAKTAKAKDDVRGLAQLVQDMLGGVPSSVAAGRNAVLPLRWHNRAVPARVDAVLRQAMSEGGTGDKAGRIDSVATLLSELLGVGDSLPNLHAWSEDGRAVMPKPARSWNLAWAAGLALAGGAAVGYFMYTQEPLPTVPTVVDLAQAPVVDLASGGVTDLLTAAKVVAKDVPAESPRDAGPADLGTHIWPKRKGPKIPELRTLDAAAPAPASSAAATKATPGAASSPAPQPGPPASTNLQPTGSPGTSPSPARPTRAQEVK